MFIVVVIAVIVIITSIAVLILVLVAVTIITVFVLFTINVVIISSQNECQTAARSRRLPPELREQAPVSRVEEYCRGLNDYKDDGPLKYTSS